MEAIAGEAAKGIVGEAVKPLVQSLVDPIVNGARYICCLNSYVENYEKEKEILAPKLQDVKTKIGKASGVSRVKNETLHWANKADNLIQVDTTRRKKWCFGKCPNCIWQYRRGKELADKTLEIQKLMERCSSKIVAGPADVPDMKYHRLPNFIQFKSRQSKFQELMEALQDENCNMIALHGGGGLGKTSLAIEVGAKLEEESKFDKVILLVVSKPPDYKKIRHEIAKHLDLTLDKEGMEEDHSKKIWSKITNMKEKLLIILDDVWDAFDLIKVLGIPSSNQHKGCNVLITTRNAQVCTGMGCQKTIHLEMLLEKEALDLFIEYAGVHNPSSLKSVAKNIVNQCGGVPVAIVAIARTLRGQPQVVWKEALKTLENTKSFLNVHEDMTNVYKCLKLSYDNLKIETAKKLFQICSLFPEDTEISIEVLSRIGIGVGLLGEVDKYYAVRSRMRLAINELIDSCLLLNAEKECVKMHDLVREVALWIAGEDIQSITSEMAIKGDLRYLFWRNYDFPNKFDGVKLEILLAFLDGLDDFKIPDTFFVEMRKLKVLVLEGRWCNSAPSLLYSFHSLKDIRTLCLSYLKLGNISSVENLSSLETLKLYYCKIIELPSEILKLKKLLLLDVEECKIKMNNPFEVIEKCSKLEELRFVDNEYKKEKKDASPQNVSPLVLERYQISSEDLSDDFEKYSSISRCFQPDDSRHLFTEATFKQLVGTAELLRLGGYEETKWKNLIPDIVSVEGGMNDLIILHLYSWPNIQCLINTRNHYSNVTAFSKLVELHLSKMDVEDLCCGSLPSDFLELLQNIKLIECHKLRNILFNGSLNLGYLKAIKLEDCPLLTSIFLPFTARSLMRLEKLIIRNCNALEYIISNKSSGGEIVNDDGDNDQKSYESILPKLKTLEVGGCDKLKIILPICVAGGLPSLEKISIWKCQQLEYIFDKVQERDHVLVPSLKEMELSEVPSLTGMFREYQKPISSLSNDNSKAEHPRSDPRAFSWWTQVCCCVHKSRKESLLNHTISQELRGSIDGVLFCHAAQCLLVESLKNIREIKLENCGNLISLSTIPTASMILLEELTIKYCHKMKCIVADEFDTQVQTNYCSILPRLKNLEIQYCEKLEFLFPSTISGGLENLKSLTIKKVPLLKYVVGKYHQEQLLSNQNQNEELHFDFPALENVLLHDCNIESFADCNVQVEGQLNSNTTRELDASKKGFETITQSLLIQAWRNIKKMKLVNCSKLISLSTLSIASSMQLEDLKIVRCHQLKYIVAKVDAKVHMNSCSIFPKLEKIEIEDCNDVEFLFPSTTSIQLKNLKSLSIKEAPELEYVVGKHHREDHSSNGELHFDVPALEVHYFEDVPKMISICSMNCYMVSPSLQSVDMKNCGIRAFMGLHSSLYEAPPFQATQSLMIQSSLITIKEMKIVECPNIISLFSLPTASTIQLEKLTIIACLQLKCIVVDDRDTVAHNSIFPKLKELDVSACDTLEHLFPAYAFRSPKHLDSLVIQDAPKLKYVLGRSHHEDHISHENQNIQTYIDFPALKKLYLEGVPNLVSISPKNYYSRMLFLNYIHLGLSPEIDIRSIIDFMVCGHARQRDSTTTVGIEMQNLTSLGVCGFKIEEIFDLTHLGIEKNRERHEPLITSSLGDVDLTDLNELSNICVGPKCILSFNSLSRLNITRCKKLRVIFSISTLKSLPKLNRLKIIDCEELVHIVEEDHEGHVDEHLSREPCFPKLRVLWVQNCNKIKYLFSITISGIFPRLYKISIKGSPSLEHVLIRQDEMKEMTMADVLPALDDLELYNLRSLISICHRIDFRKLKKYDIEVEDCPRFSLHETTTAQLEVGLKNIDSEVQQKTEEKLSSDESNMGEAKETQDLATQQFTIGSPYLSKGAKEATSEIVEDDVILEIPNTAISSLDSKFIGRHGAKEVKGEVEEDLIPKVPKIFGHDLLRENLYSNIGVETEEKLSSLLNSNQLDMREAKGRSDLDDMVVGKEVKNETNIEIPQQSTIGTPNFKVPIPMSRNPTFLPSKDNTPTTAETFEVEQEQEGDPMLLEASLSLKQTPSSTSSKPTYRRNIQSGVDTTNQQTHEVMDTINIYGKSRALPTMPSGSNNEDINDVSAVLNKSDENTASLGDQANVTKNVGYLAILEGHRSIEKIETRNQITNSEQRQAIPTTPADTVSQDESSKTVEVRTEEGASLETIHPSSLTSEKKVPIPKSPNFTVLPAIDSTSTTTSFFEEEEQEEEEGGLITTRSQQSCKKASSSLLEEEHKTSVHDDSSVLPTTVISSEQTSKTILPLSPIPSKALMSLKQTPPSSTPSNSIYGRNIQDNIRITNQPSHQVSSELVEQDVPMVVPSFYEANNALIVPGVQEIVDIMKLEGVEVSILAEALKTHPQLCLPKEDRSTRMLCTSYRVLLDILNILATRNPFTITETDKKSLVENLKDASVLGFNKDWLESVKTKVFNFDVSEVHRMQEVLKSLGDKLNTNKTELATVCDQEAEAARKVEVAQKEFEALRARHYQLSKECQDILEQRDQCWKKIASKFRHFGF